MYLRFKSVLSYFILFLFGLKVGYAQFYSGSQMEFGKNRVQYTNFKWTYYNYDKYQVYFYEGGKEVAAYVSYSAQKNIADIEKYLDYPLENKIQFVSYNKQSDFKQSNIGLVTDEQYNIGGVTKIAGSKIMVYFEGDHAKLDQQIRAGVAEVLINQMLYGGDIKDMLKNSTLLALPDWYLQGLISYISVKWNSDIDNKVRDGIMSGRYNKFNRLNGTDAVYAGHSIWNYIAETYGEQVIPNLIYMTKVSRNIESSFLFVLGISMKELTIDWLTSYQNKYSSDKGQTLPSQPTVLKKIKQARVYDQLKVSPDGKYVAYVTNELGQYKVWLYDLTTNKTKRLLKVGHKIDRINDYTFPLLAWHPSGKILSIIREKKEQLMIITYTIEEKKKQERSITDFEKILDFSYSDDGKKFVMSAMRHGQSDIYVFVANSNGYEQITDDLYDDFHPRFVHNSQKIVFTSNRINDTIKSGGEWKDIHPNKDIFLYDYAKRSNVLKQVTNTPSIDEDYPADYDNEHISYLSEDNGIRNRYIAKFDSVIAYVDTTEHYRDVITTAPVSNYSRNIIEQDINIKAKKLTEVIYFKGKYRMYLSDIIPPTAMGSLELKNTVFAQTKYAEEQQRKESALKLKDTTVAANKIPVEVVKEKSLVTPKDSGFVDINNYKFDNETEKTQREKKEPLNQPVNSGTDSVAQVVKEQPFTLTQQKNYYVNYATDYVVTQLDNSFLNTTYQKFTGGGSPIYQNPGFTGLFKLGLSDLFEDYRIVAGARLSADLNSNEYFLSYENRIKNLDQQIVLHRQAFLDIGGNFALIKIHTHDAKYVLKWPFSEVASIRGTISMRNDRTVFLASDFQNLPRPHEYDYWGSGKLEYVFDNTIKKGLNFYNGTRLKIFGEYYRKIDKTETGMYVLGADLRNYQKVHRDIIWANRLAASTSFGKEKLVYYMGGVDNWFSPKFDNSTNISTTENYAYQTLATPMRGFYQNIRNGNTFVLINSELRIPVFRYLLNRPIKSDFINNFQVVGFGDIGTAWTGKDPYSEKNSLNKTYLGSPLTPIVVTIYSQKDPIVGSYGFGLRSRIWGYFIRIDWAWGIEDGVRLPSVSKPTRKGKPTLVYLSFNLDF